MSRSDFGVVGLGVMGQNLALNVADHGYTVSVYNRSAQRTDEFLAGPAAGFDVLGTTTLEELAASLQSPRRILLMVPAGDPVDDMIERLVPLLDPGDVIIDGGNSHFLDTQRRLDRLDETGILFVGAGISGGEEGARHGPSIMPGGSSEAWPLVREVLQAIAAKADDGTPCCDWVGPGGAGHFVKMVHNGIEYGDMQLLAEAYDLMHRGLGMEHDDMAETFAAWNRGRLDSYLVEITADVLRHREDGEPLLEKVLDAAEQKGTGRWTVESALELGTPATMVSEAVFARVTSALKDARAAASKVLEGPAPRIDRFRDDVLADLEQAVHAAKVTSYAQGFVLLRGADAEFGWDLDLGGIAAMWRAGCIIRAALLEDIRAAFADDPELDSLLVAPSFAAGLGDDVDAWRRIVTDAIASGIPVPAASAALAFYDAYRTERLPANLVQALRDYFGAHTYERVDRPRGEWFHTDWSSQGS